MAEQDMNKRLKEIRDSFPQIDVRSGGDFFARWMGSGEGGESSVSTAAEREGAPTRPARSAGDTYPNHPLDYSQDEEDTRRRQSNYAGESRDSYDSTRDPGSLDFKDPNGPGGRMGDGWRPGYESSTDRQLGEMTRKEFDNQPSQPAFSPETPYAGSGGGYSGGGGWTPPDAGGSPVSNYDPGMTPPQDSPDTSNPYTGEYNPDPSADTGGGGFSLPGASDPSSGGYNPDPSASGGDSPYTLPAAGSDTGDWSSGGGGGGQEQAPDSGNWNSGETYEQQNQQEQSGPGGQYDMGGGS